MTTKQEPNYTKNDFELGQTIYIERIGDSSTDTVDFIGQIVETFVENVDDTYVTTDKGIFRLADGLEKCVFSGTHLLHLTKEGAENSALERKLKKEILDKLDYGLIEYMTLEELGTLSAILFIAEVRKKEKEEEER